MKVFHSDELALHATVADLPVASATVITDNEIAFQSKLALIESATQQIDLAYYIFSDDHTSSVLALALIDAAQRGVKVRILLDYLSSYKHLDMLSYLESQGKGKIEVRLYGRPSINIVKDAVYLTSGCKSAQTSDSECNAEKFAQIEAIFSEEQINGVPASELAISNLSTDMSGIFLSGLYGKNPNLMAFALQKGQAVDVAALKNKAGSADSNQSEQVKKLGKLYFDARYGGGITALSARIQLALAKAVMGDQINPVFNTINSFLPTERENNAQARKDWDYLTEFLHHKLLWVDEQRLILGGRNVENSYHMAPNSLASKYIFMDTDVELRLSQMSPSFTNSFERIWGFRMMVANLDEVRMHSPNDFLANQVAYRKAQKICAQKAYKLETCVEDEYAKHFQPLAERFNSVERKLALLKARFEDEYTISAAQSESFDIQALSSVSYVENLPFYNNSRGYGSLDGFEGEYGKGIHATWQHLLQQTCQEANASNPKDIVIQNAYFFLPANLLSSLSAMVTGEWDCRHVHIKVVTNSVQTTDLNVVNLMAMWQLKAFDDYRKTNTQAETAAQFSYFEYQAIEGESILSLHSKVMLFGDHAFIGSANADVRSYILDTNNGLLFQNVPSFVDDYKNWLFTKGEARPLVKNETASISVAQDMLTAKMTAVLNTMYTRYDSGERASAEQRSELKAHALKTSQDVYQLSLDLMGGDKAAAEQFNALYKVI
ncbi:phospholipase D-like domain-containing protein [Ningiella sp. W23]|uniref:phospholipase D-like domain-containing protein n=1 Tax=Ningiella sp. W23 TaxID=3023715 RepID=UPI003757C337